MMTHAREPTTSSLPPSPSGLTATPQEGRWFTYQVLFLLVAHVPLAMAMRASSLISTAHALTIFGIGMVWATRDRTPYRAISVMAYIVGAEILWRGTGAKIFWEMGKYSICLLIFVLMIRFNLFRRANKVPILFIALLIPSIAVLPEFDRQDVAKNLSGPFCLAVCAMFFSTLRLPPSVFRRLSLALLSPVVGLAAVASFSTFTAENLHFTGSSKVTSAGIGPNQVSAILGLGAMIAIFYVITDRQNRLLRWILTAVALWLLGQSALTFSRGGLANCLGALAVGGIFLLRDHRIRGGAMIRGIMAGAIGLYLLFPALDTMTGGNLGRRFSDPSLSGRDKIIQGDLLAFRENPVFGVGPGQAASYHAVFFRTSSAHTEYSRLLAEHGSFGILALLLLFGLSAQILTKRGPPLTSAFRATMIAWALLYLFHSATRLAAPSFTFGLAAALVLIDHGPAPPRRRSGAKAPPKAKPFPPQGPRPASPRWPSRIPSASRESVPP